MPLPRRFVRIAQPKQSILTVAISILAILLGASGWYAFYLIHEETKERETMVPVQIQAVEHPEQKDSLRRMEGEEKELEQLQRRRDWARQQGYDVVVRDLDRQIDKLLREPGDAPKK